mmetsp:Transcript_24367/g.45352  ORF Transcript_24367/g.45352 Transcript_24367/m.45352 type:complete len:959 (+) Transcript_24367:118-2994(+)
MISYLLLFLTTCLYYRVEALNSEQTDGLIRLAREHKRGGADGASPPDLVKATQIYKTIIDQGEGPSHMDALFELASIGTQSASDNFMLLSKASELGHAMAQHQLAAALFTGVGVGGLVPRDAGRALLLEQFSALSGTPEAHMGMGYRYIMGEGVPSSCEKALRYFEFAANEAAWQTEERQYNLFVEHSYLAREVEAGLSSGGSVGRGEVTTDMVNYYEHLAAERDQHAVLSLAQIYSHGSKEVRVDMSKVRKYLHIAATEFNMSSAAGQLGYMLATGMGKQGSEIAKKKAKQKQPQDLESETASLLKVAYDSHDSWGVLGMGYCYFKGGCSGIDRNISRALESFQRVHSKHPEASFYIGELLMGMGGLYEMDALSAEGINPKEVGSEVSSPAPLAEIQVDVASAFQFYSSASARGHVLSTHRMGQIHQWGGAEIEERADLASVNADRLRGIAGSSYLQRKSNRRGRGGSAVQASCENAVAAFKSVAEKGDWAQQLNTAHTLYSVGDHCGALRLFSQLATMGFETAQANAAFILTQSPPACPAWLSPEDAAALSYEAREVNDDTEPTSSAAILRSEQWEASRNFSEFHLPVSDDEDEGAAVEDVSETSTDISTTGVRTCTLSDQLEARAMSLYRQSALMGNAGSFRKMGDMHYFGRGGLTPDKHEAALHYQLAADFGQTHAMFNLGVMHEMGDGVEQDFHLAKRYYDQTAEYDPSARVPSRLAVYFLRAHEELQLHIGKDATDRIGAFVLQLVSPLGQISEWRDSFGEAMFPEKVVTSRMGAHNEYESQQSDHSQELSPASLLLWKCWDKFHMISEATLAVAQQLSGYVMRFSSRFAKSPEQAVSSLFSKTKELVGGSDNHQEHDAPSPSSSSSEESASESPDRTVDSEAAADFELILLLTLVFIFLVLVDWRRQRQREVRRVARERRLNEWANVTAPEIRGLLLNADTDGVPRRNPNS